MNVELELLHQGPTWVHRQTVNKLLFRYLSILHPQRIDSPIVLFSARLCITLSLLLSHKMPLVFQSYLSVFANSAWHLPRSCADMLDVASNGS